MGLVVLWLNVQLDNHFLEEIAKFLCYLKSWNCLELHLMITIIKTSPFQDEFSKFQCQKIDFKNDQNALKVLQAMLQFNPSKRPQAKDLLNYKWFDDIRNAH
ncbi:unnamed protein product [Paramecium octaurelia]|uniref:Protein kinase domain-containing protein n=1 Tax=Paramecium octaurelia TaxID=43137 RepID=A0A8S1V881_PAROT|nr:unnamed protein product [Paramecium octaurelia]